MSSVQAPALLRIFRVLLLIFLVVGGVLAGTAGSVSGAETLPMDSTIPSSTTVGESTEITGTVSIPELPRDHRKDVTVNIFVDGSQVDSTTVTLQDGETKSFSFKYEFSSSGSRKVTIEASTTIADVEYDGSTSGSISVNKDLPSSVSLSDNTPTSATIGEQTSINATVSLPSVASDVEGDFTVSLETGGTTVSQETVTVAEGAEEQVTLPITFEDSGEKTVTIKTTGSVSGKSLTESTERTIQVEMTDLPDPSISVSSPSSLTAGDTATVEASISLPEKTDTDVTADLTVSLQADGQERDSTTVSLQDGGTQSVRFSPTFDTAGEVTLTINASGNTAGQSLSTSASETLSVEEETLSIPPNLSVSPSAPTSVATGDEVSIGGDIRLPETEANLSPTLTVNISVDGRQEVSRDVTIADGSSESIDFAHTFYSSGEHVVKISASGKIGGESINATGETTVGVRTSSSPEIGIRNFASPESVNRSENVTVDATVAGTNFSTDSTVTVTLSADDETVAEESVSLSGGEQRTVALTTALQQSGNTTLTLTARATVAGTKLPAKSVNRTVQIRNPTERSTVEGAAFAVPPSLEDEVEQYRTETGLGDELQAFVIAKQEELFLVFTIREPRKGWAKVTGRRLNQSFSADNLSFAVVAATKTNFSTVGEETTISAIKDNQSRYELELVRVNATHQRLTTLTDPDKDQNFTASTTVGTLVADPRTATSMFRNAGRYASRLSQHPNATTSEAILNNSRRERLLTFSFETKFWTRTEATTDGIVLNSTGKAYTFLQTYSNTSVIANETNEPVLYVINRSLHPIQLDSVSDLKTQSRSLDGEVVELQTRLYQTRISVQESLEHATTNTCGEDKLKIKTSKGSICVNVVQDDLIHTGVAWNTVPTSRNETLLVFGVSSRHQDEPREFLQGRYQLEGEVVSTSRINESLPEGSALLISDIERVGDIDYQAVANESRWLIENRTKAVTERFRAQILADTDVQSNRSGSLKTPGETNETSESSGETESSETLSENESSEPPSAPKSDPAVERSVKDVSPDRPTNIDFNPDETSGVSSVEVKPTSSSDSFNVTVKTVTDIPETVEEPPLEPIQTNNISTSISDDRVASAGITFQISNSSLGRDQRPVVYRYHNETWHELNTSVQKQNQSIVVVEAQTPGFSYFTVSSESSTTPLTNDGDSSKKRLEENATGSSPNVREEQADSINQPLQGNESDSESGIEAEPPGDSNSSEDGGFPLWLPIAGSLLLLIGGVAAKQYIGANKTERLLGNRLRLGAPSLISRSVPTLSVQNVGEESVNCRVRCRTADVVLFKHDLRLRKGGEVKMPTLPVDEPFEVGVLVENGPTVTRVFGEGGSNVDSIKIHVKNNDIEIRDG